MVNTKMQLADYILENGLNYSTFARKAGLKRVTVRQYALRKRTRISEENLKKIVLATEGAVNANDFYGVTFLTGATA
jgi:hypothetical protein